MNSLPALYLFLAACFWGLSIPFMKILGNEQLLIASNLLQNSQSGIITSSIGSLAIRFGIAALVILCWSRISVFKISRVEWKSGSVIGLITAVSMALQVDGLNYTSASTAGFLIALYSVFIPLFLWVSGKRKMTWVVAVSCLLVMIGMATLTHIRPQNMVLGRGEWESIGAAVLFSFQILYVDGLEKKSIIPEKLTFVLCASVSLLCFFVLLCRPYGWEILTATHSSWRAGWLTFSLALFGTLFPFLIMTRFQKKVKPITAGFIYCCEPIQSALGALFLPEILSRVGSGYMNETFSFSLLLGGGLILAANVLLLREGT